MTRMNSDHVTEVVTEAVLAELAAFWEHPQPGRFTQRIPERLAGGKYDQPVPRGVQNPYWEIIRQIPLSTMSYRNAPEPDAHFFLPGEPMRLLADRHALCTTFAWSIPSPGDIAWIKRALRSRGVVEPGAGGGYWAWQLAQAGVSVAAYDPGDAEAGMFIGRKPWFPVKRGDQAVVTKHPGRSLLLCWPSYDKPWAAEALASYTGDQLFYIGEGNGGCTADDDFFRLLGTEWDEADYCPKHVTYDGIHCYLGEYRRKS
jgi:hypothetical protein